MEKKRENASKNTQKKIRKPVTKAKKTTTVKKKK